MVRISNSFSLWNIAANKTLKSQQKFEPRWRSFCELHLTIQFYNGYNASSLTTKAKLGWASLLPGQVTIKEHLVTISYQIKIRISEIRAINSISTEDKYMPEHKGEKFPQKEKNHKCAKVRRWVIAKVLNEIEVGHLKSECHCNTNKGILYRTKCLIVCQRTDWYVQSSVYNLSFDAIRFCQKSSIFTSNTVAVKRNLNNKSII